MILKNCNLVEFKKKVKSKKLVCFGSGVAVDHFFERYKSYQLESDIQYIVDNDCKKWKKNKIINETSCLIYSLDKLLQEESENVIILICCGDYVAVYEQLEQILALKMVECYIYAYIWDETNKDTMLKKRLPITMKITQEQKISKTIHYCWFGGGEIPEKNKQWIRNWKKLCPDYEIIEWNEYNYDITKNKYMYEAYKEKKWAFVSDYARIDIIYEHGGIYLDTDVEIIRNLDELLYQDAFCGLDTSGVIAFGLGFGGKIHMPFLKKLRSMYDDMSFVRSDGSVDLTPQPMLQTEFCQQYGMKQNGDFQIIENMTMYPERVLSGKSLLTGQEFITKDTFLLHHYDASWANVDVQERKEKNWELFSKIENE